MMSVCVSVGIGRRNRLLFSLVGYERFVSIGVGAGVVNAGLSLSLSYCRFVSVMVSVLVSLLLLLLLPGRVRDGAGLCW